jgi:tetratricopeptide (TPR) repeat protein
MVVVGGCALVLMSAGCDRFGTPHQRAERFLKQGDFVQAIAAYDGAIAAGDNVAVAYANRCYAHSALDENDAAVADCSEALKLTPDDPEILNNRGVAYLSLRKYDEAMADFSAALKLRPDYPEAMANRGRAYLEKKDFQLAVDELTKAIALKADLAEAYGNRGQAYEGLAEADKALEDYGKAISLSQDLQAYFNRAMLEMTLGRFDESYGDFKAIVDRSKDDDSYLRYVAQQQVNFLANRPKGFDPDAPAPAATIATDALQPAPVSTVTVAP